MTWCFVVYVVLMLLFVVFYGIKGSTQINQFVPCDIIDVHNIYMLIYCSLCARMGGVETNGRG